MYQADKYFLLLNTNSGIITKYHKIIQKELRQERSLKKPSSKQVGYFIKLTLAHIGYKEFQN